jgi:hypothetical protein
MKKCILALTLICLSIVSEAHTIGAVLCGSNGRVKITGTFFDYDGAAHPSYVLLYITTDGNVNGTKKWQGKSFITNQGKFSMDTVPFFSYNPSDKKVFWVEYEWSQGAYKATNWDGTISLQTNCTAMPITFTDFTVRQTETGDYPTFEVKWTFEEASQIQAFKIRMHINNEESKDVWMELTGEDQKAGTHTKVLRFKRQSVKQ